MLILVVFLSFLPSLSLMFLAAKGCQIFLRRLLRGCSEFPLTDCQQKRKIVTKTREESPKVDFLASAISPTTTTTTTTMTTTATLAQLAAIRSTQLPRVASNGFCAFTLRRSVLSEKRRITVLVVSRNCAD